MSTTLSYDRPSSPAREDGEVDMDLNQDSSNYETSNQGYGDDSQQRTRSTNIPKEVDPDREDGTEDGCRKLAEAFFRRYGYNTLSKFTKRGELSQFYLDTFETWSDGLESRHFKQVLFALVTDGKVCRVVGGGRFVKWNNGQQNNQGRNQGNGGRKQKNRKQKNRNQTLDGVSEELIARITAAVLAGKTDDEVIEVMKSKKGNFPQKNN